MAEPSSSETLAAAELSDAAVALFGSDLTPEVYAKKLTGAELSPDAIKYLAHTLGAGKCIEWSLACIRSLASSPAASEHEKALQAVERWLADPTDAHRRACKTAGEEAKLTTPEGCLATAVFFSDGSIAPAERDKVPPPPRAAQKISAGALLLAITAEPKKAAERHQRCLELFSAQPR